MQMDEMYLSYGFKNKGRSLVNKTLIVSIYEKTTNKLIVKYWKNAKVKSLQFAKICFFKCMYILILKDICFQNQFSLSMNNQSSR
ncbi:hypothetical protein [Spiroplasma endosymbiont of Lariophagus distinguendus]|uniref:hypothetical protein n=1 Tax=Spiroplasma endosymbiont of Lariophagus distinguendus TaxID=2935082 RepID=UPI0020794C94|nr:hypothetical protein [Spiroplasma endosymbiont of Lariophagus distinguendus]